MSTLDHRKRLSVERRNVRAFRDLACNQVARAIDEKGYLDQAFATCARAGNALLRVMRSTIWLRHSASPAVASSFGDVIGGAALFGPAAPAGAFWAAARCVAAMEQKTTAENPRLNCRRRVVLVFIGHIPRPDARSTLSRRSRCQRTDGPNRTEPSPMRRSGVRRSVERQHAADAARCASVEPSRSLLQPLRRLFDDAQIGFALDVKRRLNEAEVARHIDVPL